MEKSKDNSLMTAQDVADLLNCSSRNLRMMIADGDGPPFIRLGRAYRFDRADVEKWLKKRKRLIRVVK